MSPRPTKPKPILTWAPSTELIALTLTLQPQADFQAPTYYTTELHSWFLNQVRLTNPDLSTYLHDGQSEKAFSITSLSGHIQTQDSLARSATPKEPLHFSAEELYHWSIAALSKDLCEWLQQWLCKPPQEMRLRSGTFNIQQWAIGLPATTYESIWNGVDVEAMNTGASKDQRLSLTFTTPTSFRKRSNHMPLPIPENVFHSYLRRWNSFAHLEFEQSDFLDWVNECVVILRHDVRSQKTQSGKQGSVTGFVGAVQFGLTPKAKAEPEYVQLVHTLITCAPYFGTGHKVTFGLGQTITGWFVDRLTEQPQIPRIFRKPTEPSDPAVIGDDLKVSAVDPSLVDRQAELKQFFFSRKKRQGGERAEKAADLWAAILAHQEFGKSLKEIADDLEISYDTVRRYAKRAREALEEH